MSSQLARHWVSDDETLRSHCERWRQLDAIAVDTEFMRSSTFYPKIGLLQIGDGEANYLIDPLAINDLQPLRELCLDSSVTKVLHACSEDLEVFQHWLGCLPAPLFDTQLAAAYAGMGFSLSYAKLVQQSLDIEVEKGETRSDWLQRPLTDAQCHYAALDVDYLWVVYGKLREKLQPQNRIEWVKGDCEMLLAAASKPAEFDQAYLKIKSAWRLKSKALAVLQTLALWREETARERDIPRNRLLKDPQLLAIAQQMPSQNNQLGRIEGIHGRTLREDGPVILQRIQSVLDSQEPGPEAIAKPLSVEQGQRLKLLREHATSLGEKLGLCSELLFNKKEYEQLIRHLEYQEPLCSPRFLGWRKQHLLAPLLSYARA